MTSLRQIEANRRNALKSTGPRTEDGKNCSRRNAVRHGLTAETVVEVLEDSEDYKAFELSVTSDFDAQIAVERELVLRLASLLWRLRRATSIETGLLQIQSDIMRELKTKRTEGGDGSQLSERLGDAAVRFDLVPSTKPDDSWHGSPVSTARPNALQDNSTCSAPSAQNALNAEFARCFLRLANLDKGAFERLGRYEAALWRQASQVLLTLKFLHRQKPRRFLPNPARRSREHY